MCVHKCRHRHRTFVFDHEGEDVAGRDGRAFSSAMYAVSKPSMSPLRKPRSALSVLGSKRPSNDSPTKEALAKNTKKTKNGDLQSFFGKAAV